MKICALYICISAAVLSDAATISTCRDNSVRCQELKKEGVCGDRNASIYLCPFTCNTCAEYIALPKDACRDTVDTFVCEKPGICKSPLSASLCPGTCRLCAVSILPTSPTVEASQGTSPTTASTTEELTSATTTSASPTAAASTAAGETTSSATVENKTTAASVTAAHLKGSVCLQCGDKDNDTPCTDEDILMAESSQCADDTPYCMNDIYQMDRVQTQYKRCVSREECNALWYQQSSDRPQCTHYDSVSFIDEDLVCHLCCYGDTCNAELVPKEETLFKP